MSDRVHWLNMSPGAQLDAIRAAPPIAGEWTFTNNAGGSVRYYPDGGGLWTRLEAFPGHSLHVCVQGPIDNQWLWSMGLHDSGRFATAEECKQHVDAKLSAMGWRLL